MKKKEYGKIVKVEQLTADIYRMDVECEAAKSAVPGQFCNLYMRDESHILPRPISICQIDKDQSVLTFVYRVVGQGTKWMTTLQENDTIELMGPLGNGFTDTSFAKPLLVGGGVGVPPMLGLCQALGGKCTVVLGYRDAQTFLKAEFEKTGATVVIATDDGTVIDAIGANGVEADVIYSCGPKPMLRALKGYAEEKKIACFVSMEERMACGVGACLGCVCETTGKDHHSKVNNTRVCKDGPVFRAEEVVL